MEIICSGSFVTPSGIPAMVAARIDKIISPGTRFALKIKRMTNPKTAAITSGDPRLPNTRLFFASSAVMIPAPLAPIRTIKIPIPALTAYFKLAGIALTIASLRPRNVMARNSRPLQKTMPPAIFTG